MHLCARVSEGGGDGESAGSEVLSLLSHTLTYVSLVFENTESINAESIKRELHKRLMFECRCDARLKAKAEGSTRLTYTR